jgi:hypothetical protein
MAQNPLKYYPSFFKHPNFVLPYPKRFNSNQGTLLNYLETKAVNAQLTSTKPKFENLERLWALMEAGINKDMRERIITWFSLPTSLKIDPVKRDLEGLQDFCHDINPVLHTGSLLKKHYKRWLKDTKAEDVPSFLCPYFEAYHLNNLRFGWTNLSDKQVILALKTQYGNDTDITLRTGLLLL